MGRKKKFFIAPLDRLRDLFGGKRPLCLDLKKRFPSDFRLLVSMSWGVFVPQVPPWLPTSEPMSATLADWRWNVSLSRQIFKGSSKLARPTTITKGTAKQQKKDLKSAKWNGTQ